MKWLLEQKDSLIRAHVGLPKIGLETLLDLAVTHDFPKVVSKFALPWEEMLHMTLHWFKVDPGFPALMTYFGVHSTSTVHDVIYACLSAML